MDRVSTNSGYQSVLLSLMSSESAQNVAQQQVTTGKIADNLSGYASQADALTASRSVQARLTTQIANGTALSDQLTAQDQALSSVATASQASSKAVSEALATGDGTTLMTNLQSQFSAATSALNTQYNGRYLFSGGLVSTAPVDATSLTDLSAGVSDVFKNGQTPTVSRLNDNTTVTSGVLASTVATPLFTALQSIQAYNDSASGPLSGTLTSDQTAFLQGVLTQLNSAYTTVNNVVADNGVVQDQVTASQSNLTDQQTALTNTLGDLTDANAATAASNLALAQTAIQASAQVFSTLKSSSLLSLLSGG